MASPMIWTGTEFGEAEETARTDDVMEFLIYIATVHQMYAAFNHSKRGAVITVVSVVVGAALLGIVGSAVGALGGLLGTRSSEECKSVPQILMELSAAKKQKLCAEAMAVVKYFHWTGLHQLIKLVMSNSILRDKVLGVLTTFLTKDLGAQVKYRK